MIALHHIAMNCIDRAAQEAFYTQHLGFRRVRTFNAGEVNEFVMLRLGDCCIELFQSPKEAAMPSTGEPTVGFAHLAFEVDDLETKATELEEAGIPVDDIIDCTQYAPGFAVCFLKDPEGNIVELMQNWEDEV